jgi:predicted acylesterase/phospholipase RssA
MLHHTLYVCSPEQAVEIKVALTRLKALPIEEQSSVAEGFQLSHALLDNLVINIHIISDLDAISPHLRQNPVDLLIYDERNHNLSAQEALAKIRRDVSAFGELWGPDFLFPMSRVVAILSGEEKPGRAAFELGRVQVRDVLIAPKSTAAVLRWLKRILQTSVKRNEKVGMALSGGGLEGFLYQTGVLHALNKALVGKSLRSTHAYAGVSSGSICAALMAGNVPTGEVIKAIHGNAETLGALKGSLLFDFDAKNIAKRLVTQSVTWAGLNRRKWANKIMSSVPTGLFRGDDLQEYFKQSIEAYGHEDTFESIRSKLFIGATDQDSFEHVTLGKPPWDKVPVSTAMRASCALPPFFTPVQMEGRWFIDGQVTKTTNVELLVDEGCRLIFIIDPMKPMATSIPGSVDKRGGVFAVIQTIKALIYTRFESTLRHLTERFPDIDFIVFQPDEEVAQLMEGSPMRYRIRSQIVDIAFKHTIRQLRERHHIYSAKLSRFGFELLDTNALSELEKNYDVQTDGELPDRVE